ncbi:ribonuclease P protein component [Kaistia algarum]|uniref:ribonuclease P protein component n=1 Tax=Kaistia algarum TaxID=2083279 RepID=UPI00225AD6C6|nr:ribonuclease P protein component [Kaistia algarum]MCX5516612.1 ribonuclease P protein component [Kaistia algarum]
MDSSEAMDRTKTMQRLKQRAEFVAVAGGARAPRRGFLLQMGKQRRGTDAARFGFTVTKKTGNSPERNRIRRRLREAVRLAGAEHAEPGADYVLVGRRAALSQPFESLLGDLVSGLAALRGGANRRSPATQRDRTAQAGDRIDIARDPGSSDPTPESSAR